MTATTEKLIAFHGEPAAAWANVSRSMTRAKQADKLIELLEAA